MESLGILEVFLGTPQWLPKVSMGLFAPWHFLGESFHREWGYGGGGAPPTQYVVTTVGPLISPSESHDSALF